MRRVMSRRERRGEKLIIPAISQIEEHTRSVWLKEDEKRGEKKRAKKKRAITRFVINAGAALLV